jgi:hypothetical protein
VTGDGNGTLAAVAQVFAANRRRRAERAGTALNLLRPYERRIVREAAVMGYVLGRRAGEVAARSSTWRSIGEPEQAFPGDTDILRMVIEHCDSTDDLYPFLAAACDGRRRRITKARRWPGEDATR